MSSCKSGLGARGPCGTNEASAEAGLCDGLDAGVVYCELGGGQASSGRILLDRMGGSIPRIAKPSLYLVPS